MIIDSHAHVGPVAKDARHQAIIAGSPANSVEDYLRDMDAAGVDMGVTFGYLDLDNDYQASIQNRYPDRIVSLAWCNPRQLNAADEFRRCVEDLGVRGLKLHGWWHQHANSDHVLLDPLFEILDEHSLPVVMHTLGDNPLTTPLQTEEMARSFPNVTVFMAHGGCEWAAADGLLVAARTPNIIVDTSFMPSWWINKFVEEIGADRVSMGSDWPWHHLQGVVKNHEVAIPDPEDRAWTMGKTAARVYGIPVS